MTSYEVTGNRDLKYSRFHRTLNSKCKAMNIDFMEIRNGKIVALMEIAESEPLSKVTDSYYFKFKYWEAKNLKNLASMAGILAYIVFHNKELSQFKVFYDLPTAKNILLDKQTYSLWLENIDSMHVEHFNMNL